MLPSASKLQRVLLRDLQTEAVHLCTRKKDLRYTDVRSFEFVHPLNPFEDLF